MIARSTVVLAFVSLLCACSGDDPQAPAPSCDAGACDCPSPADAGEPDPGDAGDEDAGPVDAGSIDAGETDAGGGLDAGQPPERHCGLLLNGGAEAGDLTGWVSDWGAFQAVAWIPGSTPEPYEGGYLFFAGPAPSSRMHQDVDLRDFADEIDAGAFTAHFSGRLRDWERADIALLALQALDASGQVVAEVSWPGFAHDLWTRRQLSLSLPAGSRTLRAALGGERVQGNDDDALFDALDLCLDTEPPDGEEELEVSPYLTWLARDGVSISWETVSPVEGRVAYGPTPELGLFAASTGSDVHQQVRLTGLEPGTEYFYRIEGGRSPGAIHRVRTAPSEPERFSFAVWGDSQHGTPVFTSIVQRIAALRPDIVLSVGDLVSAGSEANYHHQLLLPLEPLRDVPLDLAPGNHDAYDDALASYDLHLPQGGRCGGFRYGPVYFLRLDTNDPLPGGSNQACLDAAVHSPEFAMARYRIVFFHEPPRFELWGGGDPDAGTPWVRDLLDPQLVDAGFDLALTGHSHAYTYGPPTLTGGLTWVTTGGAGGELEPPDSQVRDWPEITVVHLRHHFLRAVADERALRVEAIADTGEVLHSFEIAK